MVSATSGPGGGYPPRPINANERKYAQVNQTVSGATQIYRQALSSTGGGRRPQAAASAPPQEEKGFIGKTWDKLTSIF